MKKFIKMAAYTGVVALVSSSATAHYYAFKRKNKSILDLFGALSTISTNPPSTSEINAHKKAPVPPGTTSVDLLSLMNNPEETLKKASSAVDEFLKKIEAEMSRELDKKGSGENE